MTRTTNGTRVCTRSSSPTARAPKRRRAAGRVVVWSLVALTALGLASPVFAAHLTLRFIGVEYDTPVGGQSTWTYQVCEADGVTCPATSPPASSHVTLSLGLCAQALIVDCGPTPCGFVNPDPTTGITGIKWDVGAEGNPTQIYSVTLDGNLLQSTVDYGIKSSTGDGSNNGTVTGPAADCGLVECFVDAECDNGLFCDGGEVCVANECAPGTPPTCDDGVNCTVDSCNETTDSCENAPLDSLCDDGAFCNGAETCDPALDCQAGTAPDCDDGVSCTVDSCNEATDSCDNLPDNSLCDDGAFCNGVETCDPALDCQAGTAPDCDDSNSCTVDSCDEASDSCDNDAGAADGFACGDGSSGVCDNPDSCLGGACQPNYEPVTTECRGEAGVCDVAEFCDGAGACPGDAFEPATTVCRAGSGDLCDPDETCTGSSADCPADDFEPPTTVCNPGSGDLCDPDELCPGVAGGACPADAFDDGTTVCNPGSGDLCDPDELCPGVPDQACPADTVSSAGTVCNQGSGDSCDPDEVCSGVADEPCPADTFDDGSTVCRAGSGDSCDPDEFCPGVADGACPADAVTPAGTVCNPGSGDECDPAEECTGTPGEACPADVFDDGTTVCRTGSGDSCDPDELCPGEPDEACPDDFVEPSTTVCRPSSTGDETCEPSEFCTGTVGETCPADVVAPIDTACGSQDDTACTEPDTCDGAGSCLTNNQACAFVTSSSLCAFDVQPDKGMCSLSREACLFDAACEAAGGAACVDGACFDADGDDLSVACDDPCAAAEDHCEQTGQFRLLYTPDVQSFPAYKLPASNPGQTFYNLIVDGAPGATVPVTISIPFPYVTVGGQPVHVYDGDGVIGACVDGSGSPTGASCSSDADCGGDESCDSSCFSPGEAEQQFDAQWSIEDWSVEGGYVTGGTGWTLSCADLCDVGDGSHAAGSGTCSLALDVVIPASGEAYVNVHLDYGLKGNSVDANPCGDGVADRYDQGPSSGTLFAENGFDALVDNSTEDGPLGIADCNDYRFSHFDGVDTYEDSVQNLNAFKPIAGSFGRCTHQNNGNPCSEGVVVELVRNETGEVVKSAATDEDGFWATPYKHRGRPAPYTVVIYEPGCTLIGQAIELQGNGWASVDFDASTCTAEAEYGKGRNKRD